MNVDETPEDRKRRLARERQRKRRQKLKDEGVEQPPEKKAKLAEAQRLRRQQENEEQSQARLASVAHSMRVHRENESEEQSQARLASVAQSMRVFRFTATQEQNDARRAADAQSQRDARARETHEERIERITQRREAELQSQIVRSQALQEEIADFDETSVETHSCGPLNVRCQFCNSLNFLKERPSDGRFTLCCQKGKLMLPQPRDANGNVLEYPQFLRDMMTNPANPHYQKFRENIRQINSALSFASMGANIVDAPGRGPYCFKVHGTMCHRTSHVLPNTQQQPQFAQLMVLDTAQALSVRLQHAANSDVPSAIFEEIDNFVRENNRLAQTYQLMVDVEKRENAAAAANNQPPPEVSLVFKRDRQSDRRRFNEPTANEIAMVFVNSDGEPPFDRDIRVYPRNPVDRRQQFINLSILSPNLDPMTYILMFIFGEPGWQPGWTADSYPGAVLNKVRTKCSMLQYKVAQTAIRDDYFSPILHAGKLTQQWIVDSHLQVEANNLNWIRQNQKKLRAEFYQGLHDYINNEAERRNVQPGKPVILPSTFSGSPRNMRENCCDAMSIFGRYGPPDAFITFTSNPNWPEIQDNLWLGETASDRPDLVARVFKLKLNELIKELTKDGLFGHVKAFVYTIEFQKRGLPHAHILLTFSECDKFKTQARIDKFISAEIPDQTVNPRLYEIVTRNMMHGPCGQQNPHSPCMDNGKCTKKFPKDFCDSTVVNVSGYPLYRRREGRTAMVRGQLMDNRYVVPYSPYLCLKYNAHINVEACTSFRFIKYLFKYVFKGYDCANIRITTEGQAQFTIDEVSNYLSCRYVSAPEAIWRLREHKMHDRSHSVMRLPVHLPGFQSIMFEEGNEEEALAEAANKKTKLEAFFDLNVKSPAARDFLYTEIPHHFVYSKCVWNPRQRGGEKVVARMYSVSPKDIERFYLRLLLLHVKGPQSYADVRTYDGVVYDTFKQAAAARGLLDDDEEWIRCLGDASTYQMPKQLRATFAFILSFCFPNNPLELWEKFKDDLTLDFCRNFPDEQAQNLALHDIEGILKQHGMSCKTYGLPEPQGDAPNNDDIYDVGQEAADAEDRIFKLKDRQRDAFLAIQMALHQDDGSNRCFYIEGPGGSGKTFLYRTLLSYVRGTERSVVPLATTGIASTLLKGGRTTHSGFKLPIPMDETKTSSMRPNSKDAEVLRNASLIVVDEITMMHKDGLRVADTLLREIMGNDRPFGGKVFVVGGDFRQTLPVVPNGTRAEILESCVKSNPLWAHFQKFTLDVNMRSEGQQQHNDWLLKVGDGSLHTPRELNDPDLIEIPADMIETGNLVDSIFGEHPHQLTEDELTGRVILTATNAQALEINREIIRRLRGNMEIYYSADSLISDDENDEKNYPPEFLHELTPSGMPPHCLVLKKGTVVMLLRNLNPKAGLCNGTRLVVEEMCRSSITARIISESHKGDVAIIPRICLTSNDSTALPFMLKRRQFPVLPAFSVTLNKSQGQSYDMVGLDLQLPVFGHGQLYVGLSRCRNSDKIKIKIDPENGQGQLIQNDGRYFIRNVVFKEVFNM